MGGRALVEPDAITEGGRACLRDPDGLRRDPIGFDGRHLRGARETPRAVDEDADAEALALPGRDALDATALDGDRFVETPDDPDVGV